MVKVTIHDKTLLPCPFCGSDFKVSQEPHDNHPVNGLWYLFHAYGELGSSARRCLIDVPKYFDTKEEAIAAWNTRAPTALQSRIEALEAALQDIKNAVLQGGMTDIVAWQRLVIACQTTAKQALEGTGND